MKVEFSVLISIYIKENPIFLEECLESIFNQTLKPSEIIIVEDGKLTFELNEVLKKYSEKFQVIKLIRLEKNVGLGRALEIGLNHCTKELIARMDTDDICKSDRFEKQVSYFTGNPNLSMVGTNVAEFDGSIEDFHSVKRMPCTNEAIIKYSKNRNPFNHPTVMFKKNVIIECGGYKDMPSFEDYFLWLRVLGHGYNCINIDEELVYMRATKEMYKRRGGWSYLKNAITFRKEIYNLGFNNFYDFFLAITIQMINAMIPNFIRGVLYKKILRAANSTVKI